MIDMLGLRLEDPSESNFTSATKIKALNIAQRTVARENNKNTLKTKAEASNAGPSESERRGVVRQLISHLSTG